MVKSFFKWLGVGLASLCIVAILVALVRLSFYEQLENNIHLAEKKDYLKKLAQKVSVSDRKEYPNVVLILFDDMGYGDIGSFGNTSIATPNLDTIAGQGIKLTNYYSPSPVCTPSRAAMLTGRYAPRAGLPNLIMPGEHLMTSIQKISGDNVRLPADEITIAETLQAVGYRTGMVGKWHLGDHSPSLPNDFGFDYFFGAHYSNDMAPFSIYRNRNIVDKHPIDQTTLTSRYTEEAVNFIEKNKDEPFFLYMPHNFPHVPLYSSGEQKGKSLGGLYGDVVEDLDNSVATVIHALKANKLDDNTLVIITSDNGPWWEGGSGGFRNRKGDTFEGGMRVPFIVWWPGTIDGRQEIDGMASGIDLFPTILDILDLPQPSDRSIDGLSIKNMLLDNGKTPHKSLYYYTDEDLFAVRTERFKYHVRRPIVHTAAWQVPFAVAMNQGPWLFDLDRDKDESYNVSEKYPEQVRRLQNLMDQRNLEMSENPRGWLH